MQEMENENLKGCVKIKHELDYLRIRMPYGYYLVHLRDYGSVVP